jgi:hypothetical protein
MGFSLAGAFLLQLIQGDRSYIQYKQNRALQS